MIDRENRPLYIGDVCTRFDGDPWSLMFDVRQCIRDFRCENFGYVPSFLLVDREGYDVLLSALDRMFKNLPVWDAGSCDGLDGVDGLIVEGLPVTVFGS